MIILVFKYKTHQRQTHWHAKHAQQGVAERLDFSHHFAHSEQLRAASVERFITGFEKASFHPEDSVGEDF